MEETKRHFWMDAAQAGLVLGIAIGGYEIAAIATGAEILANLQFVFNIIMTVLVLMLFGKKHALRYEDDSFGYWQGVGFAAATGLMTGVILALLTYVMSNYVMPEAYDQMYDKAFDVLGAEMRNSAEEMIVMVKKLMLNPAVLLFGQCMNAVFCSVVIGLGTAAIFTRKTDL